MIGSLYSPIGFMGVARRRSETYLKAFAHIPEELFVVFTICGDVPRNTVSEKLNVLEHLDLFCQRLIAEAGKL